jgi:hypothetical protein
MSWWSRPGAGPGGGASADELLATVPDHVGTLARDLSGIARTIREQRAVLAAVDPARFWEGVAADEFDATRRSLIPLLDHAAEGYANVGAALAGYEPDLHDARRLALRAVEARADADSALRRAEQTLHDAAADRQFWTDPTVRPRAALDDAQLMLQAAIDAYQAAADRTAGLIDGASGVDGARLDLFIPGDGGGPGTVIPAPDADPNAVARWWAALTPEAREALLRDHFDQIGRLRGLPADVLDEANRRRVDDDVADLGERLRVISTTIQSQASTGGSVDPDLLVEQAQVRDQLANANKIRAQMAELDRNEPPPAYLLTYDSAGDGRFAVALGNPDVAVDTAVVVPGTGHDVRNEPTGSFSPVTQDGMHLYDQITAQTDTYTHSVIVWMGTDMPNDIPEASNGTFGDSEHGAARLHDDVAGYQAAHVEATGGDGHTTVVGHSYGSYVAGQAAERGMRVDDMVFIGSPGVGTLSVDGLGMPSEHVWAGAAEGLWWDDGDVVSDLGRFGPSPTRDYFGATVFDTSDSIGHSQYYGEGSQSLRNIGRIATGDYDGVERRPPD